jgi:proline iminopeptidase
MTKKILKIIGYSLLICVLVLLFEIFYSRSYHVPSFERRNNTQYWNLASGSKIGYTFISAKRQKKPFPIIYLHGGPGGHITNYDIHIFNSIADSGYDVYLYDQIGSGQSERLADIKGYTIERHIEDLKEIIQKLNSKKVILIGQSWGGILAALFAPDNADKIDKIIFTCPGPVYPTHQNLANVQPPDSIHLTKPFYTNAQGNKKANNIRTKAMAFFATRFGRKLASDKEADEFATYLNFELDKSTVCDTSNILREDAGSGFYSSVMTFNNLTKTLDRRPKMKRLTIPMLVMKGECDNQKWGFTNEYLELFKNSELEIIPGAGHFISVEQPQLYTKTILDFLNR